MSLDADNGYPVASRPLIQLLDQDVFDPGHWMLPALTLDGHGKAVNAVESERLIGPRTRPGHAVPTRTTRAGRGLRNVLRQSAIYLA